MLAKLLSATFRRFSGGFDALSSGDSFTSACPGTLDSAGRPRAAPDRDPHAGRCPRIACMVSFLRAELLPERDFIREASIFLAA